MLHRHLNHHSFTLAAIDDVIARGERADWAELGRAVRIDKALLPKIVQVCRAHVKDPLSQRHYFWLRYAERQAA